MTKRDQSHDPMPRGFYPTPWAAFEPVIDRLRALCVTDVVEPFAGDGALCYHLTKAGFNVVWASDINPRHPNVHAVDVMHVTNWPRGTVVSNPPWPEPRRNGEPTMTLLWRLLNITGECWMLLPADFMHNVYAAEIMRYCDEIVSVGRVKWIPGTKHQGYDNAAWYHFDRDLPDIDIRFTPRKPKKRGDEPA